MSSALVLRYGCAAASPPGERPWTNGFRAVWHMTPGDQPESLPESTGLGPPLQLWDATSFYTEPEQTGQATVFDNKLFFTGALEEPEVRFPLPFTTEVCFLLTEHKEDEYAEEHLVALVGTQLHVDSNQRLDAGYFTPGDAESFEEFEADLNYPTTPFVALDRWRKRPGKSTTGGWSG